MSSLFATSPPKTSDEYEALRSRPEHAPLRRIADTLWAMFEPYADPDFPQQFALDLHPRFWEMYLGAILLDSGTTLEPRSTADGPDISVRTGNIRIWIEAIAPDEGLGPDAVPSIWQHHGHESVPEDKIILRYTNAISEKMLKRDIYISRGVISEGDPFVIALNGGRIGMAAFEGPLPSVIRSVYPVGDFSVSVDPATMTIVKSGYHTRFAITKQSGKTVPTNSFLDDSHSGISGILFSSAALWHLPPIPGEEFLFIHNSSAMSPLRVGWLPLGKACYKEGNQLLIKTLSLCT